MSWKQTIASAILLGLVAAAVVWWLERFEEDRFLHRFLADLEDAKGGPFARFLEWQREHGNTE